MTEIGRKKILILGGSEGECWYRSIHFRSEFVVLTASSVDEAVSMHRRERAHLVIVDLDVDGPGCPESLCERIREDGELRKVSVIAVGRPASITRASRCRANSVIVKPVNKNTFYSKLSSLIDVAPRKESRNLMLIKVAGYHGNEMFFAQSENISRSGIYLKTVYPLGIGDSFECAFVIPGKGPVSLQAEVVRSVPHGPGLYGHGARFVDMGHAEQQHIESFLGSV